MYSVNGEHFRKSRSCSLHCKEKALEVLLLFDIPLPLCLWTGDHLCTSATFSALDLGNLIGFFETLML